MKIRIKTLVVFCLTVFLQQLCFAQNTDIKGSKDHPLVPRLDDYSIQKYEEHRFDSENFKTENGSVRIEGHKYEIDYRLSSNITPKGKNFILESFSKTLQSPQTSQLLNGPYYSIFIIESLNTETWVKIDPINTNGERYIVTIVEKEKMLQEVSNSPHLIALSHPKDIKNSKDHKLTPRLPDFYIGRQEETEQTTENFKTSSGEVLIKGTKTFIDYRLESGKVPPGKIQILENYKSALLEAGAQVMLDGAYYDVYKVQNNDGEAWIKIDPGVYDGKRYEVTVVEKIGTTSFSSNNQKIIKTIKLEMAGFKPEDRIIKTTKLEMTGFNPEDRIIKTAILQMTGFNPEDRIIRTAKLEMTGLIN